MILKSNRLFGAAMLLLFIQSLTLKADEKSAIVLIAHGSRSKMWNASVLNLENTVSKRFLIEKIDATIRVAFMEMAQPTIADVFHDLEKQGVVQVFAVPLFINPSGHSMFDVPGILGLYFDKELAETLDEEGIEIVNTIIQITLGPSLQHGDLVEQILLDRVRELSQVPAKEGIVLLAHGSPEFEPFWYRACQKAGAYLCAKTGITKFDYAFIEVGQSFKTEGLPRLLKMANECERVLVPGLYLGLAPSGIAKQYLEQENLAADWFSKQKIYFAEKGLLPDDRLAGWIVDRVMEWMDANERTESK
jgi:hypothetical protein